MALENKFGEVAQNEFYSAAYHRFLSDQRLVGSMCLQCGHTSLPPKPICPKCHKKDMKLQEMNGRGKLAAYTVITVAPPFMADEGFDRNNAYCSGVVQLEEGPKITARILGVNVANPKSIEIGTPLEAVFVVAAHNGEKMTFLAFQKST